MEIATVSDLVAEVRNHTLFLYEGFIKDGGAFLSDLTYKRAFEHELRKGLDDLISEGKTILIRDKEKINMEEPDGHSAWVMTAKAQRCFPSLFVTSKELKGMDEAERHRFLVERKFSNCVHKMDSWTKYKKGKGKK